MLHSIVRFSRPLFEKIALHLLQIVPSDYRKYEFLQDNAPWHKGNETTEILGEFVSDRINAHPAQGPDLNLMEDLWSYRDRKVRAANIKTIEGLKRKLTMEWEKLPWSYVRTSVKSMPSRLAQCAELEGERARY